MNIFNKAALKTMKKSRTRTLVTVIGVALSAAMITAIATCAVSLQNYMINGAVKKYGDWHVAFLDAPPSFVQERSHDEKASHTAAYENIGFASLNGGQNPDKPYLFVAGFTNEAFDTLPVNLVSGRLPENSGEVVIPEHVAANGGVNFSIGDTLSLALGSRMKDGRTLGQHDPYNSGDESEKDKEILTPQSIKNYTVVGICQRPAFEEFTAPGYTLITKAEPDSSAESFSVFVTLKNPRKVHAYANVTAEGQAYMFNDDVLRFMGLSNDTIFNTLLYSVGGLLAALLIIGSVFLIYNSFSISLNERTRQFGILASVGATAKQLRNSVLFEGVCIGIIGIPAGMLIGIPSIKLVLSLVAHNFANVLYDNVPLTLTVSVPALAAAAVLSMLTIIGSAYIPARKAASTPIMECIRQTNEVKLQGKAVKTSKLAQRICGLEGTLALKNFKRNKRRYRSIVLSLTLSVVLFISANAFGTHLKQATDRSVVSSDYDICVSTQDMSNEEMFRLYDQLQTAGGIYDSSYQAMMTYLCSVKISDFSKEYLHSAGYDSTAEMADLPLDIQFIEDREYLKFLDTLELPKEEYTGPSGKMIAVAKAKKEDSLINMFKDGTKDFTITPETNGGAAGQAQTVSITFVDTIPLDTLPKNPSEKKPYVFMIVAPYQLLEQFMTPTVHTDMGLTFLSKNPSKSVDEMETIIQNAGITSQYTIYNTHKIFEQNRNITFVVNLFTYVFVIMISLIAIANVFNTISTNIRLRRRELAMLRSIGLSDRSFNKMMRFECAFYGIRTLLIGLPAAALFSWLIYKGMDMGGGNIDFEFPWGSVCISIIGVFLIIFITMLYAVSKIKKENIIDALRDDMA